MRIAIALLSLAACGGTTATPASVPATTSVPTPTTPTATPTDDTTPAAAGMDIPMSDPLEYKIDRITRGAGEAIFVRTGVGDPYRTGIPYPIFLALLRAFPDSFGKDTTELAHKFGFVARAPDPRSDDPDLRAGLPVGMHLTIDPITSVPFVVNACALCHSEKLRWKTAGKLHEALVIGLGNKRIRIHAYDTAFADITTQPGFTADHLERLATEAAAKHAITWPTEYRAVFANAAVLTLQERAEQRRELHAKTAANPPGRVATIESFALVLGQLTGKHVDYAPDVGWAKIPDVIGYAQRTTLSWDGSGEGPIDLLAVEADVAAGVRVAWLEKHPFQGASLGAYLRQPAKRPAFPGRIDRAKARRGGVLFEDRCSDCHGHYAADGRVFDFTEQIVPVKDLGVDPARMRAPTTSFARAANDPKLTRGYTRFERSDGYVPPVLTNVWARAPYGHAGQWPSLAVMATLPVKRPTRFVVDTDGLYDLKAVGLSWSTDTSKPGFVHDATKPGFSVLGHPFIAELGPARAAEVIEYLKTL